MKKTLCLECSISFQPHWLKNGKCGACRGYLVVPAVLAGTVKWYNDTKGFGFITADCSGLDIFAHYTSIMMEGFKTLREGQKVTFQLVDGPKGPQACAITPEN